MDRPELWGPLYSRYAQPAPRRLLALDGGGIRGLITLGILRELEARLRNTVPNPLNFRLCHWFDYIAGTSTGAIIAAGLARGMLVDELIEFYKSTGEKMFSKTHLLARFRSLYTADPLKAQLQQVFGANSTLEPDSLRTLLLVVTRNASTDSPWPISSNPQARYNAPELPYCNLRIPLWQIVRASTAAPVYFPPEVIQWDPKDPSHVFAFEDGGVTPYNNPAFLLYRMATQPAYQLRWPTGEKNLLLVSVGTGAAPLEAPEMAEQPGNLLSAASSVPGRVLYAVSVDQDIICRTIGRCTFGAALDSEVEDLVCREETLPGQLHQMSPPTVPLDRDLGRAFLYARYNADLSADGLARLGVTGMSAKRVQKMDATDQIDNLLTIGQAAGQEIRLEHFGSFVTGAEERAQADA